MRPEARVAAAIEILDSVIAGEAAERVLTTWARSHRFAGSGDRSAIRDLVFDALRRRRSYGWLGGADTGRGLMLGRLRALGTDPESVFTGAGHAPAPLAQAELQAGAALSEASEAVRRDCPDWLWPRAEADLGGQAAAVFDALRDRAPVYLRVNLRRGDRAAAISALAEDGIAAVPHQTVKTALEVTENERQLRNSRAFREGIVDLQDAASQAVAAEALAHLEGARVLDYCAGGGGKALAMAEATGLTVEAHDADPGRMKDIPTRAARSGVGIRVSTAPEGPCDLVLADAPCSGSGAWRRQPEAKWRLTPEALARLTQKQDAILEAAARLVRPGGALAYATCSLLAEENERRADGFLAAHADWREAARRRWSPLDGGDGFFLAVFRRN